MPTLLDLPHEILLWVYQSLDNITDALHLAKSCKLLSHVFDRRPQNRRKILLSITDNTEGTESPDKAWLEDHFGPGSLWQPDESEFPPELADAATRTFLTTVGFPVIDLRRTGYHSTHLSKAERRLEPYDSDELYGRRTPDDDSPRTDFCFHFGSVWEWMVMVDGENGEVCLYDPGGWDHGAGYQGLVAFSVDIFAMLLGMMAGVVEDLDAAMDVFGEDEGEEVRRAVLDALRERMAEYDYCFSEGCKFWDELFEHLL
ncbi:hypothetical protein ASPVEDRAFT_43452 [Aspergillus versicolor CBS 583.65]|uniref:F-box domain-containing protein n=1 Tax=Aspergillus versicolor CBS 583.65 TaxID=1036611 RepID=A0A1L9PR48_ASPVE|nr:uncharacterized protein ASPVEDRAFT_43452 [Aspergillus versicolor CBS 583.65]OJJ04004.1 hypothetical protein ASPVEDRAFT_43452 [Aspergillus versicolor CBS 583.65]